MVEGPVAVLVEGAGVALVWPWDDNSHPSEDADAVVVMPSHIADHCTIHNPTSYELLTSGTFQSDG